MRSAMGEIFNELLATYFEQSQAYLGELNDAYNEQNFQTLERVFHSMGSSSLNMGAQQLSELAQSLEQKSTEADELMTLEEINKLKEEDVLVEMTLKSLLNGEKS